MDAWNLGNTALVSAVVSAVVSGAVGYVSSVTVHRRAERSQLLDQVSDLNRLALEFPYLENDDFCRRWTPGDSDERYQRYASYCCMVFNILERAWRHFKANRTNLEKHIGVRELIVRHQAWWKAPGDPTENLRGYEAGFREFVAQYLAEEQGGTATS